MTLDRIEEKVNTLCIWVPIETVIPNPLNPRRNDAVDSDQIKNIIKKRGWEEPLTVYKKNDDIELYVLLSGHRRLYAAREAGEKQIPVYIRERPKTIKEEIDRIASLQAGRVDWTQYEWAKYTYDRWIEWDKPPYTRFAKEININPTSVKKYITVLSYYPRHEIDGPLQSKSLSISSLDALVAWLTALNKYKPALVSKLGEDMIRKIMIDKLITGKASRESLRNLDYCELATADDIQRFIVDKNMELEVQIGYLGVKKRFKDFTGNMISMGHFEKRIPHIIPETKHQRQVALDNLNHLQKLIQDQIEAIRKNNYDK